MILLAGATGQLGSAVYNALKKEYGTNFKCLDINADKLETYKNEGIPVFCNDLSDIEEIKKILQDVDSVISVVGLQRETETLTHMDVDYGRNKNLLQAALKTGVRHFAYVSALQTREDAPRNVHKAKWLMEEELKKSGMDYTIFRPSGFFTDFIHYFGKKCKHSNSFTLIGSGNMKIQPISIDDLAMCLVMSSKTPAAKNKIFVIGGPEVMTLNELIEYYAEFFSKRIKIRHIPMGLMKFFAALTFDKVISRDFLKRLETDSICNVMAVKETFKINFTSLRDYIRNFDWSKI